MLGQLGQRSIALDGGKRHLRLESRAVVPARSFVHCLSCSRRSSSLSGRNSTYRPVQICGADSDLPPRSTLYDYFDLWSWDGTLDLIHHELYVKCREAIGPEASPTAAVIDSQSVKSAEKGGLRLIRRATTRERRSRARSGTFSSIRKAC